MPRNGAGNYSLVSGNPVTTGTTISSTTHNNTMSDIATALSDSLAKDGQTTPTANLPMGGYAHTGVGDATARTQYAKVSQIQDGGYVTLSSVSGTNTITATCAPAITAYAAGQFFTFVSAGANTGAVTLNINSLGAKAVTKEGTTALAAGEIASGAVVCVEYDGTRFQLVGGRSVQPLDADLTAIAALTTTTFGRGMLEYANAATAFTALKQAATESATGVVEKSTSAENIAGTDDTVFPSVAGVKEMIDTHVQGLGVGQSWQSVSRTSGTPVQNTSSKPIVFAMATTNTGSGAGVLIEVSSDNVTFVRASQNSNGVTSNNAGAEAIVPPLHYYKPTFSGSVIFQSELK